MSYEDLAEREATALRTANEARHAFGLSPIQFEEENLEESTSGEPGGAAASESNGRKGTRRAG
jgi:hypothetical protein